MEQEDRDLTGSGEVFCSRVDMHMAECNLVISECPNCMKSM